MKPPWPLSDREALVHFVTLDYFKDDLIIVLLNSVITYSALFVLCKKFSRFSREI